MSEKMIGYKGFDNDMKCRDFQFEVGKTYKHEGDVKLCSSGFHFCENPLDIFNYYQPKGSKFAEIEAEEVSPETESDSKRCSRKLTVKSLIDFSVLIKASVEFVFKTVKSSKETQATTGNYAHPATTGYYARSATTGDRAHSATTGNHAHSATTGNHAHSATTGYCAHSATTGNYAHSATTGDYAHSATTGDRANSATTEDYARSATTGDCAHSATTGNHAHSATTGYCAHSATTGDRAHSATTGNYAHSATTGNYAHSATTGKHALSSVEGKNSIAAGIGINNSAKGALGCWIVLAEWYFENEWKIKSVKSVIVDGKKIKADTFYTLKNGKFVAVK